MIAGEFGILLQIDTGQDLTGHTARALMIQQPDGTTLVREPTVAVPETAGVLSYTTVAADFPRGGLYRVQAQVDIGASRRLRSIAADLPVDSAL